MSTIEIHEGAEIPEGSPAGTAGAGDFPDARVLLREADGRVSGCAALWWRETPPMENERVGAIGGFVAETEEAASLLLDGALQELRKEGCTIAVGPMNGNTWRKYRFVDQSDGRRPFLLEPVNPPEYPEWWRKCGFGELSFYSSSLMPLDGSEAVPPLLRERLLRSGLAIRGLDPERYEEDLRLIHGLSLRSFGGNFLYTPLDESSFIASYLKVKEHMDPELVRIAERDGVPCGFVFGIPDLEAAARGEKPALIVKTLAVDPSSRSAGLGSLLVDELHRIARAKGYTESIHALQHQNNTSLKITGRHEGRAFRRYVLFSKRL